MAYIPHSHAKYSNGTEEPGPESGGDRSLDRPRCVQGHWGCYEEFRYSTTGSSLAGWKKMGQVIGVGRGDSVHLRCQPQLIKSCEEKDPKVTSVLSGKEWQDRAGTSSMSTEGAATPTPGVCRLWSRGQMRL